MPKLRIAHVGVFDIEADRRLVLAIEDAGVDIMHACGGNARCTTCQVEIIEGEPERMTLAERDKLADRGLEGVRLSCQIQCQHDMHVRVLQRMADTGRPDTGPTPTEEIAPEPEWT